MVQADLQAQFAVLSEAGGALAIGHEPWTWAFPLRSLEGVFGYLLVSADEEPAASELFMLRVLAQQTGIALANARLHGRERAASGELRRTNAALADSLDALQRSSAIHERLTQVAVTGEGPQGIAAALHDLTGLPVAIEDRYGNLRAWAGSDAPDPYPKESPTARDALVERVLKAGLPVREDDRLLTVVHSRGDIIGVLALIDPERKSVEQDRLALEHGATVLAMEMAWVQTMAETDLRLRRDLVEHLLSGSADATTRARADALGYDLNVARRAIIIQCNNRTGDDADAGFQAVRRAARDFGLGSLMVARDGFIVLLSDIDVAWDKFRTGVVSELGGGSCRLGVGGSCPVANEMPRSFRQAQLALHMQQTAGSTEQATSFDDLGVYRLLATADDNEEIQRYVTDWLGLLIDYDQGKGSELITTLTRYLQHGGSYDQTATALSVHRSTLKYRLQRIREISGHDLGDPEVNFNLQLATRAWQTLTALQDLG
jgi:sugar diacid utilization regulator